MKKLKVIKWDERDYRPYVWLVLLPGTITTHPYIVSAHLTWSNAITAACKKMNPKGATNEPA